jgi:hypothetical protein
MQRPFASHAATPSHTVSLSHDVPGERRAATQRSSTQSCLVQGSPSSQSAAFSQSRAGAAWIGLRSFARFSPPRPQPSHPPFVTATTSALEIKTKSRDRAGIVAVRLVKSPR